MSKQIAYLICESATEASVPTVLSSGKSIKINTTLQDGDLLNRNKRIYPKNVIQNGINAPYIQERLKTKTWYGESGHPMKPDVQRQLSYDHGNLSHIVNRCWWEGQVLKGEVESAATAKGKDFKGLIEQGCRVAFSLRAVGPVTEQRGDHVIVKDPLTIFCYDWVVHPSHASAYMDNVISESANMNSMLQTESGIFIPISESTTDFAKIASKNFKLVAKSFDINGESVQLTENARGLVARVNGTNDKVVIKLEESLQKEINNFYNLL